jgi:tetratricopeptide (TPR) repeat protein/predicted Ser/Thr protein kinase
LIGRYVVLSELGAGAMGVVMAAYDPELDRKVALKLLRPRHGRDTEAARTRLQREAQALAKLNHSNVVGVHDVGLHDGQVFVAMEFVDGHTLGDWAHAENKDWREVLGVFQEAGRGLAAAHKQGLIHRDFKPDNVMIGLDGRVRVMDFGLARADDESPAPADLEGFATGPRSALDTPLTQTGSVMGTPAYMAPEQFTGMEVTPRSDQFGFCVALFEALYGVRPFEGNTLAALAFAVTEGDLRDAPSGNKVPAWLHRVVLRGLSPKPADRFEDMLTLLVELGSGEARRRRNQVLIWTAGAGAIVASALGVQHLDELQRIQSCELDGAQISQIWGDGPREKLRQGIMATGRSFAATTADRSIAYFDAQARGIQEAQTEVCLNTRVRGKWNEDLLGRATWCLDERRMQLESLAAELSQADEKSIQKAIRASSSFAELASCSDELRLQQTPAPPEDENEVRTVRKALSKAAALSSAGKYPEALTVAQETLARAEALSWPALTADCRWQVGALLEHTGEYKAAAESLEAAYFEAAKFGSYELAAESATKLVSVVGSRLADIDGGKRWGRHADLALVALRAAPDSLRRIRLESAQGVLHNEAGEYEEAKANQERALAAREKLLGPDHPSVAQALGSLGNVYETLGEHELAKEAASRALGIYERALGPDHPHVAGMANNLAMAHDARGEYAEAVAAYERALGIWEEALGPEHPNVGGVLNNLGMVHDVMGASDKAMLAYKRALAIWEKAFGPDHPNVALPLNNLGALHEARGEYAEALAKYQRALSIWTAALGPEHPNVGTTTLNIGVVQHAKGDYAEAKVSYERSLAINEKAQGPDHPHLAYSLDGLAEIASIQGRNADALRLARRAVKIRAGGESPPDLLAYSRFILAKVLWNAPTAAGGDRKQAIAAAQEAASGYAAVDGKLDEATEVKTWLVAHPMP